MHAAILLYVNLGLMSCAAWAGSVTKLPTRPIVDLHERLHAILRGDQIQSPLRNAATLGIGRTRAGLMAVEEATKWLDDRDPFTPDRIHRVLNYAERTLTDVTLGASDRDTLAGYLSLHLRLIHRPRPANVIRMMYAHGLWRVDNIDYLITQVDASPGRAHTYRALIQLRDQMTPDQLDGVRARLREGWRTTDGAALLEEFGGLTPAAYPALIKRLEADLGSGARNDVGYRPLATEIKLRAVARLQARAGEPMIAAAIDRAAVRATTEVGREFYRRLRAGALVVDPSGDALHAPDPLRLRERAPVTGNVVELAECSRRLRGR